MIGRLLAVALCAVAALTPASAQKAVLAQPLPPDLSSYAKKSDVPDMSAYAQKAEVNAAIAAVPIYTDAQAKTAAQSVSAVIPGSFTIATMPPCSTTVNMARYAYVSDLGGGADMVVCAGGDWKHIRLGTPQSNAATTSFTITPLATPPIQILVGNIVGTMTMTIDTVRLYPGYMLYVRRPGILNVGATIGLKLAGGATFPILGQSTNIFVYDGTALVQVQ